MYLKKLFNFVLSSKNKGSDFQGVSEKFCLRKSARFFFGQFLIVVFLVFSVLNVQADEVIRAENNAYRHNNKGLMYLKENYYFGAIKEFQIAIDLSPNAQASAVYYTNLGNTYEKIGYYELAKPCFEKALSLNPLCFEYYLKTAENYKHLNITEEKLIEFQSKKNSPLNDIMIGLLYIQNGNISTGITILDDFCSKEEKLLVTFGVKNYIDKLVKEKAE